MLTNLQLVAFAVRARQMGAKYWYGTCWYDASESLLARKAKQYPAHYTQSRMATYKKHIGQARMVCDCVGLIKGFFWTGGGDGPNRYQSNNCPDTSADGMIRLCRETGPVPTMPEVPGLVLWRKGHIGVYIGNGKAIEARGFRYGVVETRVAGRGWTKWGRLPAGMLSCGGQAEETQADETVHVARGMTGERVARVQALLIKWNADALPVWGADGAFGPETQAALAAFQKEAGLPATGVCDEATWAALSEEKDGAAEAEEQNPYAMPEKNIARGAKGAGVRWIQWELTDAGFSCGSWGIDGEFGPETQAAVKGFQKSAFPDEPDEWDGIVGPKTRAALLRARGAQDA